MGGGGKGTSSTSQQSTYSPAPAGYDAIMQALQKGQSAANLPFNIPQAPVAGFSPLQQQAFGQIQNAQGMAQPYINQAQNYFQQGTQPNVSQFFNPMASAVTGQLNNIFGQQMTQATGNAVQQAGGTGADRVAVAQSNLANQQGLAAGQTLANLYSPAMGAALQQESALQGAGYGTAALGSQALNSALTGSNALLGAGGLQQQLSQAQLNAPYQQQLAQAAFPYQQAQFLAGITGSLAPGLGGTTSGYGTSTPAQPSIWSQILGGAGVGTAALGASGAFGNNGWLSGGGGQAAYSPGSMIPGTDGGNIAIGGPQGPTPFSATGGVVNPYDNGGAVSDQPIDVAPQSIIPEVKTQAIQPHVPQLNLNPPQNQSGGGFGDLLKEGMQLGKMFMMMGHGGVAPDKMKTFDGHDPQAFFRGGYADGGPPDFDDRFSAAYDDPSSPGPYPLVGPEKMNQWRQGADHDRAIGATAQPINDPDQALPSVITQGSSSSPFTPMAFAAAGNNAQPQESVGKQPAGQAAPNAQQPAAGRPAREHGFIDSPWAALMAAGLGIMGGTSPYAGVNIGQGGQKGLQMLENQQQQQLKEEQQEQGWKKLEQEAKFHEDQFTRVKPYEQFEMSKPAPGGQSYDPMTGRLKTQYLQPETGPDGKTTWKPVAVDNGPQVDASGQPIKPMHQQIGDAIIEGKQMPYTTGLGPMAPQVRAYLQSKGFDMAKAYLEAKQAEKQIQALNGPQMMRGYNLYNSVNGTIDRLKETAQQMQLGGIPFMNKLELQKFIQTEGNSPKGQLATKYMNDVNTLKEEFANLANGGYAPTEPAWKLADEQVNGNYGVQQLGASLDEIKRLIGYRMKFVAESPIGPGAGNRYTGQQTQPPGGSTQAPEGGAGGGKPDYATRKQQLQQSGLSGDPLFKKLHDEGY